MDPPVHFVARGKIGAVMSAARLLAPERSPRNQRGDRQEVTRRWPERRSLYLFELPQGARYGCAAAKYPYALPHQTLDALAHGERYLSQTVGLRLALFHLLMRRGVAG